jgi:hypothetical protein
LSFVSLPQSTFSLIFSHFRAKGTGVRCAQSRKESTWPLSLRPLLSRPEQVRADPTSKRPPWAHTFVSIDRSIDRFVAFVSDRLALPFVHLTLTLFRDSVDIGRIRVPCPLPLTTAIPFFEPAQISVSAFNGLSCLLPLYQLYASPLQGFGRISNLL